MKKAEIGDKALFIFASGKQVLGVIECIPSTTGDCWIVTEICEGQKMGSVYIQQFEMMFLRQIVAIDYGTMNFYCYVQGEDYEYF